MKTYISLFSSAGIGCYGFKMEGFECIATNELIARRLDIQKFNEKCKYESGYICGDISKQEIKKLLFSQIKIWEDRENLKRVDVLIATPPCQGMSVANHKKSKTEIIRNSLVVESIKIVKEIKPKIFIFENVASFMKTLCTDIDESTKSISEAIKNNLGKDYSISSQVINFKNYGACSSRLRTVVIGVANDYANEVSPLELYPDIKDESTLRDTIGILPSLKKFGEIDKTDIYHAFRVYPEYMRIWISNLREGESAFDNVDDFNKPHQVIDGKIVVNQRKNGDKYKRQVWDKVGPCIHTRNDLLASQNTIHPSDDRVFSIRELMLMMTVPNDFRWVNIDIVTLNNLNDEDKKTFLKKEEIKIRQSLGEAVPTAIFREIARKITPILNYQPLNTIAIKKIISENNLNDTNALIEFVSKNPIKLSLPTLSKIAELSNTKRTDNAAYFTSKPLITEIISLIPSTEKEIVRVLEPSVGVGNFIPHILKKFEGKNLELDVMDINPNSILVLKELLKKYHIPKNCKINFINDDFLLHNFKNKYDYIIGNPPFYKLKSNDKRLQVYRNSAINKKSSNLCSFFLDKAVENAHFVSLILPKSLLNTPEFMQTRNFLYSKSVESIVDYGEKGFPGVLVETIAISINTISKPSNTRIISVTKQIDIIQKQRYIFDQALPYWIIYRNDFFDMISKKLEFGVFSVFRDRQISNSMLNRTGEIRVLKSRNISDNGKEILSLCGYDSYISEEAAKKLSVFEFYEECDVYLTPNMTYKPRVLKKPKKVLVNGSLAVLSTKDNIIPTQEQLDYFSSAEYRQFYQIARNYQTRSLNVDSCSVYFYGLLKCESANLEATDIERRD